MSFIYPVKIQRKDSGLCNQIQFFLGALVKAKIEGINILLIQKFLCDINNHNFILPFSDIFDIEKMNKILNEKHQIYLFDAAKIYLNIISIKINDTEVLYEYVNDLVKDKFFYISKNYILNFLECFLLFFIDYLN